MANRGVRITAVTPGSPADQAGLRSGDRILNLNDHPVEDELDWRFFYSGEESRLGLQRDGAILKLRIPAAEEAELGWELEPLEVRTCRCDCVFCFVQQLPAGLRPGLYVKDEDYRFSFLFGNYLTLVGLKDRDWERIFRLRLSPLYVSIHATDPEIRGRLLGMKKAPIIPQIEKLIAAGIQLHGQIVLVPEWNDGPVIERTLEDLARYYPGLASLSVVPVGLTGHRSRLESLRLLNKNDAELALGIVSHFQEHMLTEHDTRWVYPADELLLLAEKTIPPEEEYEDYPQIENGVGLIRWTMERANQALERLPLNLDEPRSLVWVTGRSAYPILRTIADVFCARVQNLRIRAVAADNTLLGNTVTVAGLLGGRDMADALGKHLAKSPDADVSGVYLPPDCLNLDGLLLDDWTAKDLSNKLGIPVEAFDGSWERMIIGSEAKAER